MKHKMKIRDVNSIFIVTVFYLEEKIMFNTIHENINACE